MCSHFFGCADTSAPFQCLAQSCWFVSSQLLFARRPQQQHSVPRTGPLISGNPSYKATGVWDFIFPCFLIQIGQFCSRLQRGRTCILAQFWVECIRLARLVSSSESTRHILVDELAAGKLPYISSSLIICHLAVRHCIIHWFRLFT